MESYYNLRWINIPKPLKDTITHLLESSHSQQSKIDHISSQHGDMLTTCMERLEQVTTEVHHLTHKYNKEKESLANQYYTTIDRLQLDFEVFKQERNTQAANNDSHIEYLTESLQRSTLSTKKYIQNMIALHSKNLTDSWEAKLFQASEAISKRQDPLRESAIVDSKLREIHSEIERSEQRLENEILQIRAKTDSSISNLHSISRNLDKKILDCQGDIQKHQFLLRNLKKESESCSKQISSVEQNCLEIEERILANQQQGQQNREHLTGIFCRLDNLDCWLEKEKEDKNSKFNVLNIVLENHKANFLIFVETQIQKAIENLDFTRFEVDPVDDKDLEARLFNLQVRLRAAENQRTTELKTVLQSLNQPLKKQKKIDKAKAATPDVYRKPKIEISDAKPEESAKEPQLKTVRSLNRVKVPNRFRLQESRFSPIVTSSIKSSTMVISRLN